MVEKGKVVAMGMSGFVSVVDRSIWGIEAVLCSAFVTVMVVSMGLQVLYRYVLSFPLAWTEEVARLAMVWLTFVGASMVLGKKGHIIIDIFVRMLPPRIRLAIALLFDLSIAAFLLMVVFQGWALVEMSRGVETTSGLPVGWFYLALPSSAVLMLVRISLLCSSTAGELRRPPRAAGQPLTGAEGRAQAGEAKPSEVGR